MGISRDSRHKRRATGGRKPKTQKKRAFEKGRPAANTRIGSKRIRSVRCRGGNLKYRALRLDHGNFSWGSENCTRATRILDVVYNASNNELVRTKTLVKNAIVQIDAAPFKLWRNQQENADIEPALTDEMAAGKLLACIASRPGQSGRADGYILESKELEFYKKKLEKKKKG
eukprot:GHVL01039091.1.p1 GENE.GHVL01039091.1~~GHVL01039091.1.p1  ORF type:complete len:172 (+),score=26.53 GHVL01039091.1:45-560(+)